MNPHLSAIVRQRDANAKKWGAHKRNPANHLLIATEELGEVARAMQTDMAGEYAWPPQYNPKVYEELVDLGAVVLAMMEECLDDEWEDRFEH